MLSRPTSQYRVVARGSVRACCLHRRISCRLLGATVREPDPMRLRGTLFLKLPVRNPDTPALSQVLSLFLFL